MNQILQSLHIPPHVIAALPIALVVCVIAVMVRLLLNRMLNLVVHRTAIDETTVRPLRTLLSWFVGVAAVAMVLSVFGFNVGGLWGSFTAVLAMIAVGFVAVWSVLSNFSCTLVILFTRPFAVGDRLAFPGEQVEGEVADLNFVHTTLRTDDGSLLRIPNNLIFQKVVRVTPHHSAAHGQVTLAQQFNRSTPAAPAAPAAELRPRI